MTAKSFFESVPSGKIYSFYSINLRYLFTTEKQKDLELKLKILLKDKEHFFERKEKKCSLEQIINRVNDNFAKAPSKSSNTLTDEITPKTTDGDLNTGSAEKKCETAGNDNSNASIEKIPIPSDKIGNLVIFFKKLYGVNKEGSKIGKYIKEKLPYVNKKEPIERLEILKIIDQGIAEQFEQLNEIKSKANMFLASREYNYFAKNLDVLNISQDEESQNGIQETFSESDATERAAPLPKPQEQKSSNLLEDDDDIKLSIENREYKIKVKNLLGGNLQPLEIILNGDSQKKYFVIKDETESLKKELENGKKLRIFRQNLIDYWLGGKYYKIYEIDEKYLKNNLNIKEDNSDQYLEPYQKENTPSYFLRLSKLGVLQIRKEESLPGIYVTGTGKDRKSLVESLTKLAKHGKSKSSDLSEEALIALKFCELIKESLTESYQLSSDENKDAEKFQVKEKKDFLKFEKSPELSRLESQRHMVIILHEIENCDDKELEMKTISEQALAILEGRFLHKTIDARKEPDDKPQSNPAEAPFSTGYEYRKVSDKVKAAPKDLSTWDDELCFFSAERSLIYLRDDNRKLIYPGVQFPPVTYEDYWNCVIRGIEFSSLMRMALRINASKTNRLVQHIPRQLINFDRKDFSENKKTIDDLEKELAHLFKIIPEVRNACAAINMFRSERNVKKFDCLQNECFQFKEILGNIQTNTDDLTNFITMFKQRVLQGTNDNENRKLNIIALIFTLTTILYVFPSFVNDFAGWKFTKDLNGTLSSNFSFNSSLSKEGWLMAFFFSSLLTIVMLGILWFRREELMRDSEGVKGVFDQFRIHRKIQNIFIIGLTIVSIIFTLLIIIFVLSQVNFIKTAD